MAVIGQEVEVLQGGTDSRTPSNASFVLNMLRRRGAWEVRDGFGQVSQYSTTISMPAMGGSVPGPSSDFGIQKHIGSHVFETNQGHIQVLSIFTALVATANSSSVTTAGTIVKPNNLHQLTRRATIATSLRVRRSKRTSESRCTGGMDTTRHLQTKTDSLGLLRQMIVPSSSTNSETLFSLEARKLERGYITLHTSETVSTAAMPS